MEVEYLFFEPSTVLIKNIEDNIKTLQLLGAEVTSATVWTEIIPETPQAEYLEGDFAENVDLNRLFPRNYFIKAKSPQRQGTWKKIKIEWNILGLKMTSGAESLVDWNQAIRTCFDDALQKTQKRIVSLGFKIDYKTAITKIPKVF